MLGLYQITNSATGDFYVGSARSIERRWRQHRHDLRRGKHTNVRLQRSWNKYGEASFVWRVLAILEPQDMHDTERRLLDAVMRLPSCYNMAPTPTGGMTGRRHSPESIAKMSNAQRGRRHSEETKAQMSAARKGRRQSEETKLRLSAIEKANWARLGKERKQKTQATLANRPESVARIAATRFKPGHCWYGKRGAQWTDEQLKRRWAKRVATLATRPESVARLKAGQFKSGRRRAAVCHEH